MGREESKEAGIVMMRWVVVERVLWMIYETRDEDSQAKERKGEAKAKIKKRVSERIRIDSGFLSKVDKVLRQVKTGRNNSWSSSSSWQGQLLIYSNSE